MLDSITTRRGFLSMSTVFATMLAACATTDDTTTDAATETISTSETETTAAAVRETITDTADASHAIAVSGESAAYAAVDVVKSGDADGDEADFYGTNAAVYAEGGATLDLDDVTVTTDGLHANAVFSYGEGTTVTIKDSVIETSNNCSGGIMVTGGGTLTAQNLTIHTTGNSSAAIRSDRGGGTQTVTGGTYVTDGTGSPVVYSTADVSVEGASLTSTASQGIVVEGKNSVMLKDCELVADNNTKNSDKSSYYQAVMVYQSMSGDAAEGQAAFAAAGGSITNAQGDIFFVTNTVANISLADVKIENADAEGVLLRACGAGWGSEGSNGGHVTFTLSEQEATGDVVADESSEVNVCLTGGSVYTGAVNADGAGRAFVYLEPGCTWELTADSVLEGLSCDESAIKLAGHTLTVAGEAYVEGCASTGELLEFEVESTSGPGGKPGEGGPGSGSEPPAKPDGASGSEPPAKPEDASEA